MSLTPRLTYLLENLVPTLCKSLHIREGFTMTPIEILELFTNVDPSRNKSATQWLMNCYISGDFRHEDIRAGVDSKVFETLVTFGLYRDNLPEKERSLTAYKTLGDMWTAIAQFIPLPDAEPEDLTGRALKRAERDKARAECYILRDNYFQEKSPTTLPEQRCEEVTIVVPKTEFAAKWWGRGTRWCTAADKDNAFDYYKDAPLIIFVLTGGEKYQLYVSKNNTQFMDSSDNEIFMNTVGYNWEIF